MRKKWRSLHLTLRIGLITLILGTSPLLIIMGLDALGVIDGGNPVVPGLLVFISFWPSIILIVIGSIFTFSSNKKAKKMLANNQSI